MEICLFCGKTGFKQFKNHVRQCPKNPDATPSHKGHLGANQFTTGKAITHSDETKKKLSIASSVRTHSEHTKQKLSDIRKQFLLEHPEKVPYLMNHSSSISYPESYFAECFKDCVEIQPQYQVQRFKLDFANAALKKYVEIDGEQHYVDRRIVEHDTRRTDTLQTIGWQGFRIRWAKFIKLTFEEKEKVVEAAKQFLGV